MLYVKSIEQFGSKKDPFAALVKPPAIPVPPLLSTWPTAVKVPPLGPSTWALSWMLNPAPLGSTLQDTLTLP
jgi:hypothetical protein